jgi:hypothetical protein
MIPEPIMPTSIVNAQSNFFHKRFAVLGKYPTEWALAAVI